MTTADYYQALDALVAGVTAEAEAEVRELARHAPSELARIQTLAEVAELTAIRARLRAVVLRDREEREGGNGAGPMQRVSLVRDPIEVDGLTLDPATRRVCVDGVEVPQLSAKEFQLLRALASEPTRVFTAEDLLRSVWGFQSNGRTRTLHSHASRLRRKIDPDGERFIRNVWGVGYRLVDQVEAVVA